MTLYADIDRLRTPSADSRAQITRELAVDLRAASDRAGTLCAVVDELHWLNAEQKARADRFIASGDNRSLGKLLCEAHEQLVAARTYGAAPRNTVLFDEAH